MKAPQTIEITPTDEFYYDIGNQEQAGIDTAKRTYSRRPRKPVFGLILVYSAKGGRFFTKYGNEEWQEAAKPGLTAEITKVRFCCGYPGGEMESCEFDIRLAVTAPTIYN